MRRYGMSPAELALKDVKKIYPEAQLRERRYKAALTRRQTLRSIVYLLVLLGIAVFLNLN